MNDWIERKRRQYFALRQREWRDELGHDREWWRAEARRIGTDWSSLLRKRIRVLAWIKAGRPPLREWMKRRSVD